MASLDERLAKMTPLQRAVLALKETQERLEMLERQQAEPIAIIGMACRFPGGANHPAAFWRLLCESTDAIRGIPPERWDADDFYDPNPQAPGTMNTRWGGFLERIDEFDNHFFGISDREAARIDPQHRLLLELAWEALEDAGLPPARLRGSPTGVFIGISHSEYGIILYTDRAQADGYAAIGTAHCIAANRISFAFDFVGPSVSLDTACSGSLVSTHLACHSLRRGECTVALAGGVNIMLSPMATVNLTKLGLSSSDGRVRAFDAAAAGYVRSEGAGLVVLKLLSAARRDGDPIYAVIRGSAMNQNGFSNGLTAPSRQAQERVLRQAYAAAQRSPALVQYVETQGTGTRLGDAIEAAALGAVVGRDRPPGSVCGIGSVKTNIGHMESASGVASLMKVALALQHRQLPPTLHFRSPNPDIPFAELGLKVQQQLEPWPNSTQPRLAGVSAFGFGGSNVHLVLEEAPAETATPAAVETTPVRRILALSARTETALRDLAQRYAEFLRQPDPAWRDICHTAAAHRDHHDCRLALLADSPQQAAELLAGYLAPPCSAHVWTGRKPFGRALKVAFLLDGQPEPWRDSLPRLQQLAPRLADAIEEVDAALQRVAGWRLAAVSEDAARWQNPAWFWPAVTALQLALAAWWRRVGVLPHVVLGRGIGEVAAACVAGILTPEDGLQIAVACGKGTGACPRVPHHEAAVPFLSASDGQQHTGSGMDGARWERCLTSGDSLDEAWARLQARQADVYLEVGPVALASAIRARLPAGDAERVWATVDAHEESLLEVFAALYAAGADLSWDQLTTGNGPSVRLPTYPWQRQRLWVTVKGWLKNAPPSATAAAPPAASAAEAETARRRGETTRGHTEMGEAHPRPDLNTPYVAPRTALEQDLARSWAEILKLDRAGVHDNFFELGGDSLLATILLNRLQDQLGEVVHVLALFQSQTIHGLAEYLRQQYPDAVRRLYPQEPLGERHPAAAPPVAVLGEQEVALARRVMDAVTTNRVLAPVAGSKNPRVIFVLSPPRSGTTLLRVMLAGHGRLFAPPELELLGFDTMAARKAAYEGVTGLWLEGAVRALMEVCSCEVAEARAVIARYEQEGRSTQEFFRLLQDGIGGRVLVDKTPSYSGQLHVLQRAEAMFDQPLYIHLLRHPCGMIRSFVDYKLEVTYNARLKVNLAAPFTPQQIAELVWVISHQNILQALESVPAERCCRLRFEDLVRQPEAAMRSLCGFLGLDFQEGMIQPYARQETKMIDGVVAEARMQGDQKFLVKHKAIDPAVADDWKKHMDVCQNNMSICQVFAI
jgi:acyl transferase domain-containing protein